MISAQNIPFPRFPDFVGQGHSCWLCRPTCCLLKECNQFIDARPSGIKSICHFQQILLFHSGVHSEKAIFNTCQHRMPTHGLKSFLSSWGLLSSCNKLHQAIKVKSLTTNYMTSCVKEVELLDRSLLLALPPSAPATQLFPLQCSDFMCRWNLDFWVTVPLPLASLAVSCFIGIGLGAFKALWPPNWHPQSTRSTVTFDTLKACISSWSARKFTVMQSFFRATWVILVQAKSDLT